MDKEMQNNSMDMTVDALMAAAGERDQTAEGHSQRVSRYSVEIGKLMGLNETDLANLRYAAGLHDIGKIAISRGILNKLGSLNEEEFEVMKRHSTIAIRILDKVEGLDGATPLIKHHHERFDGKGYPGGLAGGEIPLGSRIIAIAETFDILTSDVPWRDAMDKKEALQEIESCSGTQFDPSVVDAFKQACSQGLLD